MTESKTESKIAITHRLIGEGRWQAACVFRDRVRKERRDAGRKRAEANDEAWRQMAEKFPPLLPGSEQTDDEVETALREDHEDDDLPSNLPPGDGDFEADVLWAWQNIGNDAIKPEDAPNGSAWFTLLFGRGSPERFVPIVVKTLGQRTDAKQLLKDRDFQFGLLENITREYAGVDAKCPKCGLSLDEPLASASEAKECSAPGHHLCDVIPAESGDELWSNAQRCEDADRAVEIP